MNFINAILKGISIAFACVCVGTTFLQVIGGYALWTKGALTPRKVQRYAAVLYGLDLADVPMSEKKDSKIASELLTREQLIERRVAESKLLGDRKTAIKEGSSDARKKFDNVRFDNNFFEQMKVEFDAYLKDQEQTAREEAIQEVERMLAVLTPRQSKELILRMLVDKDLHPMDDVMSDIVTIIKSMPESKLKKIMAEFKTEDELDQLFEIMAAIGDIEVQ